MDWDVGFFFFFIFNQTIYIIDCNLLIRIIECQYPQLHHFFQYPIHPLFDYFFHHSILFLLKFTSFETYASFSSSSSVWPSSSSLAIYWSWIQNVNTACTFTCLWLQRWSQWQVSRENNKTPPGCAKAVGLLSRNPRNRSKIRIVFGQGDQGHSEPISYAVGCWRRLSFFVSKAAGKLQALRTC